MLPLSNKSHVEVLHAILGEVDDFGQIDLAKRAGGTLRIAKVRMRKISRMDLGASIELEVDSNQFEVPPTFTIELNHDGPRVYVHGVSGELAVTVTVTEDGSIRIERH